MLKLAIQKSGRLHDDSLKLLKDCGILIDNGRDQLKATARNFDLEVLYLRNGDIPQYLKDGVAHCAIIGENLLLEKDIDLRIRERLGFARCRVSLAIPKSEKYSDLEDFRHKRIATSYPNTVRQFFRNHGIEPDLHIISGSVEIAPNIGLAEAICDIVSSGSTLFQNNLKEVQVIFKSEAVLAEASGLDKDLSNLLDALHFRIQSVLQARTNKYILMNAPLDKVDAISSILPVLRSPTVLPLAEEGWCSIHSVIKEDKFWEVIDQLKKAGAEGILVCPIEKMVL